MSLQEQCWPVGHQERMIPVSMCIPYSTADTYYVYPYSVVDTLLLHVRLLDIISATAFPLQPSKCI